MPVNSGVRVREEGDVGNGNAEQFKESILIDDPLLFLIVDHPERFDLPKRCRFPFLVTNITRAVDALVNCRNVAITTLCFCPGQPGLINHQYLKSVDDTGSQFIGQLDIV